MNLSSGIIFDIKKFALHDGPGIRTTVFLKGCPLSCRLCHNPESQESETEMLFRESACVLCEACLEACESGALATPSSRPRIDRKLCLRCGACADACPASALERIGREATTEEVMDEIERDVVFYDRSGGGATFSGGEPLAQPDFLHALLHACRRKEIHTAVDTCGFAPAKVVDRIREETDLFLYDLKIMDADRHEEFTGRPNDLILDNFTRLVEKGASLIARIPVLPGINDLDENLSEMSRFLASLKDPPPVDLLPYHRAGAEKYARLDRTSRPPDLAPPTEEDLSKIARFFSRRGLQVFIGGEPHDHE